MKTMFNDYPLYAAFSYGLKNLNYSLQRNLISIILYYIQLTLLSPFDRLAFVIYYEIIEIFYIQKSG